MYLSYKPGDKSYVVLPYTAVVENKDIPLNDVIKGLVGLLCPSISTDIYTHFLTQKKHAITSSI